ncbi:MAG: GDSL-type esterase/lipase family protein, partial [Coprococcus sp.]
NTEAEGTENTTTEETTEKDNKKDNADDKNSKTDKTTTEKESDTEESTLGGGASQVNAKVERPTQYKKVDKRESRNDCYGDIDKVALTTDYPYIKVDKDYFEDALFIGDSRVEGLALYSGIENADFAYMEGLTVDGMMSERIAKVDGATLTIPELLSSKEYKKIYVMLGVNEVGYDTDYYVNNYIEKIHEIMDAQPDAIVFMMGCMYVSTDYSKKDDIINNDNIDDKNNGIAAYANGIDLFYFDVNTAIADESGGLKKEYTWDDIHLQAQYYVLWENYLLEHGLEDDMWK